jgi:hypothetical protein
MSPAYCTANLPRCSACCSMVTEPVVHRSALEPLLRGLLHCPAVLCADGGSLTHAASHKYLNCGFATGGRMCAAGLFAYLARVLRSRRAPHNEVARPPARLPVRPNHSWCVTLPAHSFRCSILFNMSANTLSKEATWDPSLSAWRASFPPMQTAVSRVKARSLMPQWCWCRTDVN